MINFGTLAQRSDSWSWLKPMVSTKSIVLQYEENSDEYLIYGYDVPEVLFCTIWTGVVPDSVINAGYSQAQNDADKSDFETNFKPYANRPIGAVPSKIIANSIKSGGSANLAVDGSVTPVVFEYNPPADYDIEVTALSLLFEDTTAFAFGSKFIINTLSTLTNGLLLEVRASDAAVTWQNMKRTRDIIEICDDFDIITGTPGFMRAKIHLPKSLILSRSGTYASEEYLRVTVRDDLSSLDFAEAHFQGVKI